VRLAREVEDIVYRERASVALRGFPHPVSVYEVQAVAGGGLSDTSIVGHDDQIPVVAMEQHVAPVRVLLVDDHRLFREGVVSLLERAPDIQLVGEAGTGEEAIQLAARLLPDVVLMDVQMPGIGGINAAREIVREYPHTGIIMLTMFEDEESVFAALTAGARGYVLKDADRGSLLRAIRAVAGGEALLGAAVARRVLDQFQSNSPSPPVPIGPRPASRLLPEEELTPREREVLQLITQGLRNREIAERLVLSEKTVGNHISNIFAKLQVNDRSQAILHALRRGLVHPES
jgi:DNA-binding NarL/FixJ family response regulator